MSQVPRPIESEPVPSDAGGAPKAQRRFLRRGNPRAIGALSLAILGLLGLLSGSLAAEPLLVTPILEAGGIRFQPEIEAQGWRLTVSGPGGFYLRHEFPGSNATLALEDGATLPGDGRYVWELRPLPGGYLAGGAIQSGSFQMRSGALLLPEEVPESLPERRVGHSAAVSSSVAPPDSTDLPAPQPLFLNDDYYIGGRLAFGFDIDGTESFGAFFKMLVEDNNIQFRFTDTSVSDFATTDWLIKLGDTTNFGAEYFRIEDLDAATQPFRIDAGAATNSLRIDQDGRVGLGTATPATKLHVVGDTTLDGDFTVLSSRNAKEAFAPVDSRAVLARLAELPLAEWSYKGAPEARHMGPVAEDFHAAFPLGKDDLSINPLDVAGVALAAIQGLQAEMAGLAGQNSVALRLIEDRDREIARLEEDRQALAERLAALEEFVHDLAAGQGNAI
jgi:hypothetical protein